MNGWIPQLGQFMQGGEFPILLVLYLEKKHLVYTGLDGNIARKLEKDIIVRKWCFKMSKHGFQRQWAVYIPGSTAGESGRHLVQKDKGDGNSWPHAIIERQSDSIKMKGVLLQSHQYSCHTIFSWKIIYIF